MELYCPAEGQVLLPFNQGILVFLTRRCPRLPVRTLASFPVLRFQLYGRTLDGPGTRRSRTKGQERRGTPLSPVSAEWERSKLRQDTSDPLAD